MPGQSTRMLCGSPTFDRPTCAYFWANRLRPPSPQFGICLASLFATFVFQLVTFRLGTERLAKLGLKDEERHPHMSVALLLFGFPHLF